MNKNILTLALVALVTLGLNAQTNVVTVTNTVTITNTVSASTLATEMEQAAPEKEYGGYEVTFGAWGTSVRGENTLGLDVSLSSNPFEKLPNLWVGVSQGLYWEPSFSGSTDIYADWNTHIYKELYLNTGWSVGCVYDTATSYWRTGPEASLQYYVNDGGAFIYGGLNWRINEKGCGVNDGLDYSFGIGLAF